MSDESEQPISYIRRVARIGGDGGQLEETCELSPELQSGLGKHPPAMTRLETTSSEQTTTTRSGEKEIYDTKGAWRLSTNATNREY